MTFPCSKCGACCITIGCPYLGTNNLCSIYNTRPIWCRVDEYAEKYGINKEIWYAENLKACDELRRKLGKK